MANDDFAGLLNKHSRELPAGTAALAPSEISRCLAVLDGVPPREAVGEESAPPSRKVDGRPIGRLSLRRAPAEAIHAG